MARRARGRPALARARGRLGRGPRGHVRGGAGAARAGGAFRRLGRPTDAGTAAARALELGRALELPRVVAQALDEQARLSGPDDALERHHGALAIRAEHGLRWAYARSLEALASLAAGGGQEAHAVRLLAAAESTRRHLGCPRPLVEQAEHATLLARLRGASGFEAEWAAGGALSPEEAVGYARRSRGSRDRPLSGWASLTPAERDVVGLAVEGLSNPDIGARLFMSRHTVKTHLSHVYAKLDLANRTELAAAAAERAQEADR